MKTRFITATLLLAALVGSSLNAQAAWPGKRCKGSGKLITREIAVAPFTALEVSNGANVTLTTGSGPAVVETDDNMMEVGSINSIFYFLHKAAEPFNCLEQDNLTQS